MVCHATGVLVVAAALDSEEVAALKEVDYILYALSSGRTEEVDDLGLCVHCLTVHRWGVQVRYTNYTGKSVRCYVVAGCKPLVCNLEILPEAENPASDSVLTAVKSVCHPAVWYTINQHLCNLLLLSGLFSDSLMEALLYLA